MLKKVFVLLILAAGVWAFLQKPIRLPIMQNLTKDLGTDKLSSPKLALANEPTSQNSISPLEKKLHEEASLIGRIDVDPESTEARLKDWALSLSDEDLAQLEKLALDIHKPQDDRFLAVMLIGWSEKAFALDLLKDIALAEIDPYLNPNRMGDFERVLRMQAVDGMSGFPSSKEQKQSVLQSIATRSNDSTIVDRTHRAMWAQDGKAPSPQQQDDNALNELLEKKKL